MRNMNNSQQTITSALQELVAEAGISEADFGDNCSLRASGAE